MQQGAGCVLHQACLAPAYYKENAMDRPVKFSGSKQERVLNEDSHHWLSDGLDEPPICFVCDAKYSHEARNYRCGEDVPRENIQWV